MRPADYASQERVDARRRDRMARVDALPPDWRELVHDYGLTVVNAFRQCGVLKAKHARHIIRTVLDEVTPFTGGGSVQGVRTHSSMREPPV